jgi:RsmE family RNA methyltransferase
MNLILLERGEARPDGTAHVTDARATHIRSVLRATPGQALRVGLVGGPLGTGVVTTLTGDGVTLACTFEPVPPPRPLVDLLLAVPRPKVLRRLWAQLAALGVGRIVLTNAERVERNYFDTHLLQADHYQPLLIEGLQQARDTHVPHVSVHRQFRVLVEDELDALCPGGLRIVAHPQQGASIHDAVSAVAGGPALQPREDRVLLAVGPEGGWNTFEMRLLESHGFVPISMGTRILRSDTACIALLALVHETVSVRDAARARNIGADSGSGIMP